MGKLVFLCYGERQVLLFNSQRYSILARNGNLERHYDANFPPKSEIHKLKLKELKSKSAAQQQLKPKPRSLSNNATISSFKVSGLIVKK
jgi:hypothetical protein